LCDDAAAAHEWWVIRMIVWPGVAAHREQARGRDPYALKLAEASVNETQDAQGWWQAMENTFKNYTLTLPHRIEMGTYGPAARAKAP